MKQLTKLNESLFDVFARMCQHLANLMLPDFSSRLITTQKMNFKQFLHPFSKLFHIFYVTNLALTLLNISALIGQCCVSVGLCEYAISGKCVVEHNQKLSEKMNGLIQTVMPKGHFVRGS